MSRKERKTEIEKKQVDGEGEGKRVSEGEMETGATEIENGKVWNAE